MAESKTAKSEKEADHQKPSLLERERTRLRRMQITFLLFCIVLIASMLLALALRH